MTDSPPYNVTRLIASRAKLSEYLNSPTYPHLSPLFRAAAAGCAWAIVPQNAGPFRLPADRACILVIGDDLMTSLGPGAFHLPSLRRFIKTCRVGAVIACEPLEQVYAAVCGDTVYLNRNSVIVETDSRYEADWTHFLRATRKDIAIHHATVQPEGHG